MPCDRLNLPAVHCWHSAVVPEPEPPYPGRHLHSASDVAPVALVLVPAGHEVQFVSSIVLLNLPFSQMWQVLPAPDPAAQYPGAHLQSAIISLLASKTDPAVDVLVCEGHARQRVVFEAYNPHGHDT